MKRMFGFLAAVVGTAVVCWAAYTGGGKIQVATTSGVTITNFVADTVSIYNVGPSVTWVLINQAGFATTNAAVSNAAVAGTATPIPSGLSYTFDVRNKVHAKGMLTSVALATTSAVSTNYVSWY